MIELLRVATNVDLSYTVAQAVERNGAGLAKKATLGANIDYYISGDITTYRACMHDAGQRGDAVPLLT